MQGIINISDYQYLRFTNFKELDFWDYYTLSHQNEIKSSYKTIELGAVIKQRKEFITINDNNSYKRCRVQIQGKGVVLRDEVLGKEIKTKKQQLCKQNDFLVAEIDAKVGGFGIVPLDLENAVVSSHYFLFEIDTSQLLPEFLATIVKTNGFLKQVKSTGSTNYSAIRPYHVLGYKIPLPSIKEQEKILREYNAKLEKSELLLLKANKVEKEIDEYLYSILGLRKQTPIAKGVRFQLIEYADLIEWGIDKIKAGREYEQGIFPYTSIEDDPTLALDIFRGKSPVYAEKSKTFILNQKCNRWNNIDLTFVKYVDESWYNSIEKTLFTREGDIIINSTGEGTIGRASYITKDMSGLIYDSHILLLRLNNQVINPSYFVEVFNSEIGQKQVNSLKSAQATKQTELGVNNLRRIKIPLPPTINQQIRLVETISAKRKQITTMISERSDLIKSAIAEFEKTIFD